MNREVNPIVPPGPLQALGPRARIAALAEHGSITPLEAPGLSPHLARFGVTPHPDDGIVTARVEIAGLQLLLAAQDEGYLGGSVGERHGAALRTLFERAVDERPAGVVLLLASAGVRLHEANAAELAFAKALSALHAACAAGIPVVAICLNNVFGGASVLATATDRWAMLPGARVGLSGPKVIESVHGAWELDTSDPRDIDAVFGATARAQRLQGDFVLDDVDTLRAWILQVIRDVPSFEARVRAKHRLHASMLAGAEPRQRDRPALPCFDDANADASGMLWRTERAWLMRPFSREAVTAADMHAMDAALLRLLDDGALASRPDVVIEDSAGHAVSRGAEMSFVSAYFAQHAAVLALLRTKGVRTIGCLAGVGHSAAFFVNALQCSELCALATARVIAMEPASIARVTGVDAAPLIEDDPMLGQPIRHFARLDPAIRIINEASLREIGVA